MTKPNLIVILGPTASGKTSLAVSLSKANNGAIISADSRQVYRGMDIGTGKDLVEYGDVSYSLIDICDPGDSYNLFAYVNDFNRVFQEISSKGKLPFLVGGSGLYLDAVVFNYHLQEVPQNQPLRSKLAELSLTELQDRLRSSHGKLHNTTDLNSRTRLVRAIEIAESADCPSMNNRSLPAINPLIFGISWDPAQLRERIGHRLNERMAEGLIQEARQLHQAGLSFEKMEYYGLEYKFLSLHLKGELNRNDMIQKLRSAICQFAKRQRTWFRRMERKGAEIHWLSSPETFHLEAQAIINSNI